MLLRSIALLLSIRLLLNRFLLRPVWRQNRRMVVCDFDALAARKAVTDPSFGQ
jgi:hypothetical protein